MNHCIRRINVLTGNVDIYAGTGISGYTDGPKNTAQFVDPHGIAFGPNGDLYVADAGNNVIRKINTITGEVTTVAGSVINSGTLLNGSLLNSGFNGLMSIIFDNMGNIYVADTLNNVVRYVNFTTDSVSTYAGTGLPGNLLGLRVTATFNRPTGLALDEANNLYISDTLNDNIKLINFLTGVVTVYAGDSSAGFADGPAIYAEFNKPQGLLYDIKDNALYVADTANHSIRKIKNS